MSSTEIETVVPSPNSLENDEHGYKIPINKKSQKAIDFALVDKEDYDELSKYKWCFTNGGYPHATINGKTIKMHIYIKGKAPKGHMIDHINRNKLDNRRSNLEFKTFSQNAQNKQKAPNSSSSYVGVHWDNYKNKWRTCISVQRKTKNLGCFDNEIDAAIKYDMAAFV